MPNFVKKISWIMLIYLVSDAHGMENTEHANSLKCLSLIKLAENLMESPQNVTPTLKLLPQEMRVELMDTIAQNSRSFLNEFFNFYPVAVKFEVKESENETLDLVASSDRTELWIRLRLSKTKSLLYVVKTVNKINKVLKRFDWQPNNQILTALTESCFRPEDVWLAIPADYLIDIAKIVQKNIL